MGGFASVLKALNPHFYDWWRGYKWKDGWLAGVGDGGLGGFDFLNSYDFSLSILAGCEGERVFISIDSNRDLI